MASRAAAKKGGKAGSGAKGAGAGDPLQTAAFRSVKRAKDMFLADHGQPLPEPEKAVRAKAMCKVQDEYRLVQHMEPPAPLRKRAKAVEVLAQPAKPSKLVGGDDAAAAAAAAAGGFGEKAASSALALRRGEDSEGTRALALQHQRAPTMPKPKWHPHWSLYRVVSGHTGWVRAIAVEPGNEWFATGSTDRTIKIWDLASCTLKLTLTGHISTVRGLAVSKRQPYLFSVGEDKTVKCWDLEQNKVIRHYHGHLSAVYCLALHPTVDVVVTGSRDSTVRVWDMRTKAQVMCFTGHTNTIASLETQAVDPQIISGSHDSTIRLWDIRNNRCMTTLTHHKKSVRALAMHPTEFTFASASPDNIKQWYLPKGKFIQNLSGHNSIVNAMAVNTDDVLVSGGDNGSLRFWDYRTGHNFQKMATKVQPGSLDAEAGIYAMTFDRSYSRLLTAEADKTIKVYREDPNSTEETHPLEWTPQLLNKARY